VLLFLILTRDGIRFKSTIHACYAICSFIRRSGASGCCFEDDLQSQLFQLCTQMARPRASSDAVYTLARLLNPNREALLLPKDHVETTKAFTVAESPHLADDARFQRTIRPCWSVLCLLSLPSRIALRCFDASESRQVRARDNLDGHQPRRR
jgi:hypothetical protein